jgi:MSHA biogenesis protein MshN
MSVVNRMLRELDARGAPAPAAINAAASGIAKSAPRRPQRPAVRLGAIVIAGAAAIGMTAFADLGPLATHAAKMPEPAAVAEGAANATPAAVPTIAPVATPTAALTPAPITPPEAHPPVASPRAPDAARSPAPVVTRRLAAVPNAPVSPVMPAAAHTNESVAAVAPARIDKRTHELSADQRLAQLYRKAVDAAQAGQRLAAIATLRELLAAAPSHVAARQLAAALEQEAGAPERAVALLREGLALPQRGAAGNATEATAETETLALPLARLLAAQGLDAEALQLLDQHRLGSAEAQGLRAGLLARRGDFAAALPAYEAAARAQPMQPLWWLGLAVALESLGDAPRARQAFAKAQAIGLPREDLALYVEQRLRALE